MTKTELLELLDDAMFDEMQPSLGPEALAGVNNGGGA